MSIRRMAGSDPIPRVAIVAPDLRRGGGVPAVAAFLYHALSSSGRYWPTLISLGMSWRDPASARLLSPRTWRGAPYVVDVTWGDLPVLHVGARFGELEWRRYLPRRALTALLDEHDVVQIVAGTPAVAHVARDTARPVALQVATLARLERRALLAGSGPRRLWHRLMTTKTSAMDRTAFDSVDVVLVENAFMQAALADCIPADQLVFAPPGVDTSHFRPDPHAERTHLLSVARFSDPRKNVHLLIEAYALLRAQLPSAPQLVLAGHSTPPPDAMELAHRLGIASHIRIEPAVDAETLARLYRQARLFVLSSDEEGLGIVILEAMASGTPVVATRCGGPEFAIEDGATGFLVPLGDAAALADRMRLVLTDDVLAASLGRSGRVRAESVFSRERAARPFLEVYDRLLTDWRSDRARGAPHSASSSAWSRS